MTHSIVPVTCPGLRVDDRTVVPASVSVDDVWMPGHSGQWPGSGPMVSEVKGWLSPGARKSQPRERVLQHGGFSPRGVLVGASNFTITGAFLGSQVETADFGVWLAELASKPVTVAVDSGVDVTERVALASPDLEYWHATRLARWAIDFVAPDPRRYGPWKPVTGTGTSVQVANGGSAPSRVWLELTRSGATQRVTADGQVFAFTSASNGRVLSLDPRGLGEVCVDGGPSGGVTSMAWPTVPPRSTLMLQFSGVSSWTVRTRDGWW